MDNKVDFYAVSFVKDAAVVHELKNYLKSKYIYKILHIMKYANYNIEFVAIIIS